MKYHGYRAGIEFVPHQLGSIVIYTPSYMNQCFDQAYPCAVVYHNNLEMRGETVSDGFRVKGNK
ncbi:hypothetical protein D0T53_02905 [Dysgonomonas sp. 216]|nr:hypothetical protein [Dysgonomonas sp. 216]